MRWLLLAFFCVICPPAALGQSANEYWVVGAAADHSDITFVDTARIERRGSIVRSWVATFFNPSDNDREYYEQIVSLYEYDCEGGRYRIIQSTAYGWNDEPHAGGTRWEWRYSTPDTHGERVLRFACAAPAAREEIGDFVLPPGISPREAADHFFAGSEELGARAR